VDKSEAEQIRNQYSEETTKLSNMQNQISELETKLKEDFGLSSFLLSQSSCSSHY